MQDQNFIDSEWRPARSGATDDIAQPGHRRGHRHRAGARRRRRRRRRGGRRPAPSRRGRPRRPRERSEALHELARRIEGDIENLSAIESRERRQARLDHGVRDGPHARQLAASSRRPVASSRAGPPASTWRATRRCCAASRSASSARSPRGTTRSTWPPGRWRPRWRSATPSCSSRPSSRPTPRCASPSWPPTSSRRACSTSCAARARPPASPSSSTPTSPWCRSPARWRPARPSPGPSSETLKRVHLELGGKAPVVVFDDADPAAVAAGVRAGRLLQLRPGLHRRLPRRSPGPKVHDDVVAALVRTR